MNRLKAFGYTVLVASLSWIMVTMVVANNATWWQALIAFIANIVIPLSLWEEKP